MSLLFVVGIPVSCLICVGFYSFIFFYSVFQFKYVSVIGKQEEAIDCNSDFNMHEENNDSSSGEYWTQMFYIKSAEGFSNVNCQLVPYSDVSGVGVHGTFLHSSNRPHSHVFLRRPGLDIFLTQITFIFLVAATYFDSTIDVPHMLIAS